ncbi:heme peroxidase [Pseudomassariella vexata]|uniref:Heme peroxidase n=1 Tax=Pseudomassariella vexata TaxID=1141098 RepID=A0A1Y2DYH2_9PEZI|nr:heme peroxidase [Pseudomassariella vexata]ORY64342.1 heme peroxidase [Pseudomassariella vexata]
MGKTDDHGVFAALDKYGHLLHAAAKPVSSKRVDGPAVDDSNTSVLKDVASLDARDVKTLFTLVEKHLSKKKLTDDRTMFMENLVTLVSKLPDRSPNRARLSNAFTKDIWGSLDHPPPCGLGDVYNYRQADGSYNNIHLPELGKAGAPYARSVQPRMLMPASLPDPDLIFDVVMSRDNGGFKPHPNNISSMLFYMAILIIHDCFRTSRQDPNVSTTSSYLDLAPLYGSNKDEQASVRAFEDGKLKPDCFSEKKLLGFPPGVVCLVIMFNRFHNYTVTQLATINENGRFSQPAGFLDAEKKKAAAEKRDENLFQTARLVTCGLYVHIILHDYLRTILNLNRTESTWWIDPQSDIGDGNDSMASGNQVSLEFNLIYRWHSCVSLRDEKWTQTFTEKLVGKDHRDASTRELLEALAIWEEQIPEDPQQRSFEGLQRQADGKFNDDELARILIESIEDLAGSFGANNVPAVLRAIDVLGIQQARGWHTATLNEFRKFFGLEPHKTFQDVNSDPVVAKNLESLFEHPDYLELYPGIVCEEAKPPMVPGSGLAPGYTISRAILSDAITLVRGDRHYTLNYHPRTLTNWGFKEVESDPAIEEGCVFYKLILRAFPQHFEHNSVYAHYPMVIPSENEKILRELGRADIYEFRRPRRLPAQSIIKSPSCVKTILGNNRAFGFEPWRRGFHFLGGDDSTKACLAGDGPSSTERRGQLQNCLHPDCWETLVKQLYEEITMQLLQKWSCKVGGAKATSQVDIIRDVGNIAGVHFAAQFWSLPLKTQQRPHGIVSEHELRDILILVLMIHFYQDVDPVKTMPLLIAAKPIIEAFDKIMKAEIQIPSTGKTFGNMLSKIMGQKDEVGDFGVNISRKLHDYVLSPHESVYSQVLVAAAPMVANNAEIFAQIIDFYLGRGKEHLSRIRELAKQDTSEADKILMHYAMEGIRLNGSHAVLRYVRNDTTVLKDEHTLELKAGQMVFADLSSLAMDPTLYPEPETVRLDRPLDSYKFYVHEYHKCLGAGISRISVTAMLKVVARLDNLRRAPGPQGEVKTFVDEKGCKTYMDAFQSTYSPIATGLKVLFDGQL